VNLDGFSERELACSINHNFDEPVSRVPARPPAKAAKKRNCDERRNCPFGQKINLAED
jgi:hypothetical protein